MMQRSVFGAMPIGVPLTKIALSSISFFSNSGSEKSYKCSTQSVSFRSSSMIPSARLKKSSRILNTEISATPSSAACTRIAAAAPPAPRRVIFFSIISFPASFTERINPIPSVVYPFNTPSSLTTVFTAPPIFAAGESSSTRLHIRFLSGMVRLNPLTPSAFSPSTATSNFSVPTSNARYA